MKTKKKDPFEEIIEILQDYDKGFPARTHHDFEICMCNDDKHHKEITIKEIEFKGNKVIKKRLRKIKHG